jgi:hydroxyethylthiazole kinase-like sugar kinase family protein
MPAGDIFTAKRETAIAKSKVREVFTPSQPVTMAEFLLGRDSNIGRLIEILNTPGQHALLFGDRGVGKSSLANVTCAIIKMHEYFDPKHVFYKICGSEDTFESILKDPLRMVGIDASIVEASTSHKEKAAAKLSAVVATGDLESIRESSQKRKQSLSVSSVADLLKGANGLLVIDEADAIKDDFDKKRIAELIKLLSDCGSGFKIMVVGIAETGTQLIAGHKSVERCLGEVKLDRLAEPELWKIIKNGQTKIKGHRLEFDHEVVNSIVTISNGYPYFTHLLALKCAEEAIVAGRYTVRKEHLIEATMIAAEGAEGALRSAYQKAIRSSAANGDLYRIILLAAAKMPKHEFAAKELREEVCRIWGKALSQSSLGNFYATLISESTDSILRRVSKGIYCFNDPRMPSFIRIVNSDV